MSRLGHEPPARIADETAGATWPIRRRQRSGRITSSRIRRSRRGRAGADMGRAARAVRLVDARQPQGDRPALHRDRVRVLRARRRARGDHAPAAVAAEQPVSRAGSLQPDLHDARHRDDVPLRRAGDGGVRHLLRAVDGRRAEHRFSAAERLQLLDVPVRRHLPVHDVLSQHRSGRRLVRVRAAGRPAVHAWQTRRRVGAADHVHRGRGARRVGRNHRDRLQDARARHVVQPDADLRLGAGRHRVHGDLRDAVGDARQHLPDSRSARSARISSTRRRAAIRCCGSTSSGSSATPRSTSSSSRRPG